MDIAYRIREIHFRESQPPSTSDWGFKRQAIDRVQIEELSTGEFIGRQDNLPTPMNVADAPSKG